MSGPRKSILVVGTLVSGGVSYRSACEDLAERLEQCGWEVHAVSNKRSRLRRLAEMVTTAWGHRDGYYVAYVDVFSGAAFIWAEAVCWTLRRAGKPYVLALRGGSLPDFSSRWPRRVENLLQGAAVVVAPSRFLLDELHVSGSWRVVPNPLAIETYLFRPRREIRPRLIWLRSFHEIYNPSLAVEVLARLTAAVPDIRLTMIGPDKGDGSRRQVEQRAAAIGVADRITLTGGVPKNAVPGWLDRGDLFLNTTNVDNTPVSVLEAMASGLCIVSTDVGGIRHLLKHEHDALLVPPDDADRMAEAVRRVISDAGLAERLSRNARRTAEQFDWTVVLPQWENALTDAMARA